MNILFSLTNLTIGGAQMFVLNLAREFSRDPNYRVYIYDHQPEYSNPALYHYAGENVQVLNYGGKSKRFFIQRWNGFLARIGFKKNFRDNVNEKAFSHALKKYKIDVVNSQMSASDFICGSLTKPPRKLLITLHGEFELYLQGNVPGIEEKIDALLQNKPLLIYTADKNKAIINPWLEKHQLTPEKVYIGIRPENFTLVQVNRTSVGIGENDFVLGMISRGIPEKGWEFLLKLFFALKEKTTKKIHLFLIGDGAYVKELVQSHPDPNIHLIQFGNNYQNYFSYYPLFDVFVFPTFFPGESVPTVVAESLFWNVPVIANEVAEIPRMISSAKGMAGTVIAKASEEQMMEGYLMQLTSCIEHPQQLEEWRSHCFEAFEKFKIENIKKAYEQIIGK
jgi:glycosyltransferase involved in cell wall biosynthesis